MIQRMTSRVLAALALTGCLAVGAIAAERHEGKVVEANNNKLTMTNMDGSNKHTHDVASDAKITREGKTAKLEDLKKGDTVDVLLGDRGGKEMAIELAARPGTKDIKRTTIEVRSDGVKVTRDPVVRDKDLVPSGTLESARASKIIGTSVMNRSDENLGKIEEIVLDPHRGKISYAVLSFGGFLGVGDKWFAIPWDALNVKYDNDTKDKFHFVLNIDKERLKNAPGFDKNHFPDVANPKWSVDVDVFYKDGTR